MKYLPHMAKIPDGWGLKQMAERREAQLQSTLEKRGLTYHCFDPVSDRLVGICCLMSIDYQHRNCEAGVILHHQYQQSGSGSECLYEMLRIAFECLGMHRVHFITRDTNVAARGLMERTVRASFEGVKKDYVFHDGAYFDVVEYAVFESDWPAMRERLRAKFASAKLGV
jgi:RimJ/RimL family protein N-acetyltransferase